MQPAKNPSQEEMAAIIARSKHDAAKWLKDAATSDVYYWPADEAFHQQVADMLGISKFDKGIAVPGEK